MFDYVTNMLSTGITVPTVILWCVIAAGVYAKVGTNSSLFRILIVGFLVMSIPMIPKLLFSPLDVGDLKVSDAAAKEAKVLVVIANGSRTDAKVGYQDLSNTTARRLAHAEKISKEFSLPIIVSTTDKLEVDLVVDHYNDDVPVLAQVGGPTTRQHLSEIRDTLLDAGFYEVIVLTAGSHAYRTKLVLENMGFTVPQVIVGEKDGDIDGWDLIPSFRGYLYWQLVLKEYWALGWYLVKGIL